MGGRGATRGGEFGVLGSAGLDGAPAGSGKLAVDCARANRADDSNTSPPQTPPATQTPNRNPTILTRSSRTLPSELAEAQIPNQSAGATVFVPARISKYKRAAVSALPSPTVPMREPNGTSSPTFTSMDPRLALTV